MNKVVAALGAVALTLLLTTGAFAAKGSAKVGGAAPTVTGVTMPPIGHYGVGQNLDFIVNFNEPVYIPSDQMGGVTFRLDVGHDVNAAYVSGGGSSALLFRYTVQPGDVGLVWVRPALDSGQIFAVSDGSWIQDMSLYNIGDYSNVVIDSVGPNATGFSAPPSANYTTGQTLDFEIPMSEPVFATDAQLAVHLDSGDVTADLDTASSTGTSILHFQYVVQPGDSSDGIDLGSTLQLNGSPIRDEAGNDASFAGGSPGPIAGVKINQTDPVDTTAPDVVSVDVPAAGIYTTGDPLDLVVHFSEPVNVFGGSCGPMLLLFGIEPLQQPATYLSGSGTSALIFRYTVQPGDHSDGGLGIQPYMWQCTSDITDNAGNHFAFGGIGNIGDDSGVQINGAAPAAPVVTSVDVPGAGIYKAYAQLAFTVHFDTAVYSADGATLTLTLDGGRTLQLAYDSGEGTSDLTFKGYLPEGYTDGDGITVTALDGSIVGDSDTSADLTLHNVGSTANVVVDSVRPVIDSVEVPAAGIYREGQQLKVIVHYSKNVLVDLNAGFTIPRIAMSVGSSPYPSMPYVSGGGSSDLTFEYRIQPGDSGALGLGGADRDMRILITGNSLVDAAGNSAEISFHNVGDDSHVLVDAEAPRVIGVVVPLDGRYKIGDRLEFTVTFSEPVTTNGNPALGLTVGTHARSAGYLSGSGTDTLRFRYTVEAGDTDANGIEVGRLTGTITDAAGHGSDDHDLDSLVPGMGGVTVGTSTSKPTPTPTPSPAPTNPTPGPAPAAKDTIPPTKPASPTTKVKGRQVQVSFGESTDNVKVVGYRLYRAGTAIAAIDGTSFKLPITIIRKPGRMVLELRALDAAGNRSEPVVLTLTRHAAPKMPKVVPAWAWNLARWQHPPKAKRGIRPHTPTKLPKWYGKWNAWHKAPVKVTVG